MVHVQVGGGRCGWISMTVLRQLHTGKRKHERTSWCVLHSQEAYRQHAHAQLTASAGRGHTPQGTWQSP